MIELFLERKEEIERELKRIRTVRENAMDQTISEDKYKSLKRNLEITNEWIYEYNAM